MPNRLANLLATLKKRLEGARRIAVLAVGSDLRGDDAAGLLAGERLRQSCKPAPGRAELAIFLGHTAPENLTSEIKRFAPTHLIVLDAADVGRPPGEVELIEPERLAEASAGSTHRLPINVLTDYLRDQTGCQVVIIGIQPAGRRFGQAPSPAVLAAAEAVSAAILAAVDH